MKRLTLSNFGKGLDSTRNPSLVKEGYARISQNLLHNRGDNRAELRAGINLQYSSAIAAVPIYGFHEYINNSGTTTNILQTNGVVYSWTSSSNASIDGSHQATNLPRFSQALNFWLEADHRDNNYIGNGTAGYPFQIAAPSVAFTATAVADATAADFGSGLLTVGAYQYDYSRYSTVTGEVSPPRGTAVSVTTTAGNQRVTLNSSAISATEQFDQIQIYRTLAGGTKYFELAKVTAAQFDAGVTDGTTDAVLQTQTVSTNHTSAGASKTSRPEAATDVVVHRGRIHFVGLSGARSRHRWSQLNSFTFDSTTDARHDVDVDDGDFLWRAFSYDGSLVLFKDHSIHVMNGDVNELSFTWQVGSDKHAGIGAYCPFTAVATPIGIIFQGECGVYLYRPGMKAPQLISDAIQETLEGLDYSRRLFFVGGYDHCNRAYFLSVTPSGQTTNTRTYVFFIDTGFWSTWVFGDGAYYPSVWGSFHSSSRLKAFFGSTAGLVYETDTTTSDEGTNIEGILSLSRLDCGSSGYKRFLRINYEFQSQTHGNALLLGYTIDGDTQPTTTTSITQTGIFRASILVNRIGLGLSPYISTEGTNNAFEILKVEVDYAELTGRLPQS